MNGRAYDPEIGRFLSPDIVIQDVTNLQAWNAYTYVLNNPLSYTDPTGFFFGKIFKAIGNFFKAIFKAIGRALKAIAKIPILSTIIKIAACGMPVGPQLAACIGITVAFVAAAGGSVADAIIAGTLAFVSHGAGLDIWGGVSSALSTVQESLQWIVKPLVHGGIQGAMSVAQGGEFIHGFAAGAVGAVAGLATGSIFKGHPSTWGPGARVGSTAIAAVAGGTASKLAGGKFANGAITAAFAHMYNQMSAEVREAMDRAALKALREAYDPSATSEYGGLIYKVGDEIYTTPAYPGPPCEPQTCSVNPFLGLQDVPPGATIIGLYHTHPPGSENYFSQGDVFQVNSAIRSTYPLQFDNLAHSYLGAPNGVAYYYEARSLPTVNWSPEAIIETQRAIGSLY